MRTRFLPIFFGVVFALTLFFAVAAGAQEERTDTDGVGVQAVEVQQQQVQNDQQQGVVALQEQVGVQAQQGCPGADREAKVSSPEDDFIGVFDIEGDTIRLTYQITNDNDSDDKLFVEVTDEDDKIVRSFTVRHETNRRVIRASTDPGRHRLEVEAGDDLEYYVIFEDCEKAEASNDNDNNNNDGNNNNSDNTNNTDTNTDTDTDTTTTTTDTDTTTTGETTTADNLTDSLGETTTPNNADSVREADAFRCEFFLRAVRDDTGALRDQYRDGNGNDEEIVQRFEQCLSGDVLADTIPNRKLPFTGGMSMLFLGAIGLAAIVAGVSVLRAVMRHGR